MLHVVRIGFLAHVEAAVREYRKYHAKYFLEVLPKSADFFAYALLFHCALEISDKD
jgi:hypothetical protein